MIKPTQAQIEAAARAAYENWIDHLRDLEPSWDSLPDDHRQRLYDCQRAALTAAAEVGENENKQLWLDAVKEIREVKALARAGMKERCARLADEKARKWRRIEGDAESTDHAQYLAEECEELAAAIRALKDQP